MDYLVAVCFVASYSIILVSFNVEMSEVEGEISNKVVSCQPDSTMWLVFKFTGRERYAYFARSCSLFRNSIMNISTLFSFDNSSTRCSSLFSPPYGFRRASHQFS